MNKYLVTGANGFIGIAVVGELSKNGDEVIAVIRDQSSDLSALKGMDNVRIVFCDMKEINRLSDIVNDADIDACLHLAWQGSTGDDRADYIMQLQNVVHTVDMVKVIKKMNVRRLICAGSLAEIDVLHYHGLDGATPNVVSHYGIAKITANYMTKAECSKYEIDHIWCYLSNTYGEGNRTNNFINFASKLILGGKRASFTAGEQMYDFVYVKDAARAIIEVAKKGKNNTSYFIGSTKSRRLKEYIKIIRDTIDPSIPLYLGEIQFRGTELPIEVFDSQKLINDTGYSPKYSFESTIGQTIEWIKGEMNR